MMRKLSFEPAYILMLIFFLLFGCRKDPSVGSGNPAPPAASAKEVSISGKIVNTDASGVQVTIDGNATIIDSEGKFSFTGTVKDTNKVILRFSKPGYIDKYSSMVVENDAIYSGLEVFMTQITETGTFNGARGGTVNTKYSKFIFEPNSILKEDGSLYGGEVTAIMNDYQSLDSDRRAYNKENEKVVLQTFFYLYITLRGQAGENLKLSKPMSFNWNYGTGNPPVNLPVWVFDEADTKWEEKGAAVSKDGTCTGSSVALGYIQVAKPYAPALLRAFVHDGAKVAPSSLMTLFFMPENFDIRARPEGVINSKGICLLYVPASIKSSISIYAGVFDRMRLLSYDANTFASGKKTELDINVSFEKYLSEISGTIENCGFVPVSGRAEVVINDERFSMPIVNGNYKLKVISRQAYSGGITIFDLNNKILFKGDKLDVRQGKTYTANPINVCNKPQVGSISFTANGQVYNFQTPKDSLLFESVHESFRNKDLYYIKAFNPVNKQICWLVLGNPVVGTNKIDYFEIRGAGVDFRTELVSLSGTMDILKYKSGSTMIEGSFSVKTFDILKNNTVTYINGIYKVEQ